MKSTGEEHEDQPPRRSRYHGFLHRVLVPRDADPVWRSVPRVLQRVRVPEDDGGVRLDVRSAGKAKGAEVHLQLSRPPVSTKRYLGDGVYVDYNAAGQLVLTTENGVSVTNEIYLEPEVYGALTEYVRVLRGP